MCLPMKKFLALLVLASLLTGLSGCSSWFKREIHLENERSDNSVQVR